MLVLATEIDVTLALHGDIFPVAQRGALGSGEDRDEVGGKRRPFHNHHGAERHYLSQSARKAVQRVEHRNDLGLGASDEQIIYQRAVGAQGEVHEGKLGLQRAAHRYRLRRAVRSYHFGTASRQHPRQGVMTAPQRLRNQYGAVVISHTHPLTLSPVSDQ
jgi:hypothetical protein